MNVVLSKQVEEKLEKLAATQNLPKEEFAQEILRKYVHLVQFKQLQKKISDEVGISGSISEEEFLNLNS